MEDEEIVPAPLFWEGTDLTVLAKYGNEPYWAGKICRNNEDDIENGPWYKWDGSKYEYWVVFYNDYKSTWIDEDRILRFTENNIRICRRNGNQQSIVSIREAQIRLNEKEVLSAWDDATWTPEPGDLVLVKREIYPPWPAVVKLIYPREANSFLIAVKYLGNETEGIVPRNRVWKYSPERSAIVSLPSDNILNTEFQGAVIDADGVV